MGSTVCEFSERLGGDVDPLGIAGARTAPTSTPDAVAADAHPDPSHPESPRGDCEQAQLEHLLAGALERYETEGEAALERAAREQPELAEALLERFDRLRRLGLLPEREVLASPDRIGRFDILERIGEGGMGVVFRARDPESGRVVAVKQVRPEYLVFEGARERFEREARAIGRFDHPNIVRLLEVGDDEGQPFLVLEFLEGSSLADRLALVRGRDPRTLTGRELVPNESGSWLTAVLNIARQIASALVHSHSRGVLHRDVKPSNVLVTPDGRARLLDFGLARTDDAVTMTRSGSALGSLASMAPEQAVGGTVDERADVYGLGVLMYELLTLQSPFAAATPEETLRRVREGRFTRPRRVDASLPRDVETVLLCALELEPRHRYESVAALAADLDALAEGRAIAARSRVLTRASLRGLVRHRALVATAAVVLVVGGAVVARALSLQQRSDAAALRDRLATATMSALYDDTLTSLLDVVTRHELEPEVLDRVLAGAPAPSASEASAEGSTRVLHALRVAAAALAQDRRSDARTQLESALESLPPDAPIEIELAARAGLVHVELLGNDLDSAAIQLERARELAGTVSANEPATIASVQLARRLLVDASIDLANRVLDTRGPAECRTAIERARSDLVEFVSDDEWSRTAELDLLVCRARAASLSGDDESALELARSAVERLEELEEAQTSTGATLAIAPRRLLARLSLADGDTERARSALEDASRVRIPSAASPVLAVERLALTVDRAKLAQVEGAASPSLESSAEAQLTELAGRIVERFDLLERIGDYRLELAQLAVDRADWETARTRLETYLRDAEGLHLGTDESLVRAELLLATVLQYLERWAESESLLESAITRLDRPETLTSPGPEIARLRAVAAIERASLRTYVVDTSDASDVERTERAIEAAELAHGRWEVTAGGAAELERMRAVIAHLEVELDIARGEYAAAAHRCEANLVQLEGVVERLPEARALVRELLRQRESAAICHLHAGELEQARAQLRLIGRDNADDAELAWSAAHLWSFAAESAEDEAMRRIQLELAAELGHQLAIEALEDVR